MTLASARLYPDFVAELEAATGLDDRLPALRRPSRRARPRRGRASCAASHELQRSLGLDGRMARPARVPPSSSPGSRRRCHGGVHVAGRGRGRPAGAGRGAASPRSSAPAARSDRRRGRGAAARRRAARRRAHRGRARALRAGRRARRGLLVGQRRVAAGAGAAARAPGQGPDPRAARARPTTPVCERIVASERVYLVPRADGRADRRRDRRGARLRHHRDRRRRPRAAARGLPAAPRRRRAGAGRGERPGCGPGRPTTCRSIGPGALDGLLLATGHYRNGDPAGAADRRRGRGDCSGERPTGAARRGARPLRRRAGVPDEDRAERRAAPSCADGASVADAVARQRRRATGAAASRSRVDGEVVPRSEWAATVAARGPERRGAGGDPGWLRGDGTWRARRPRAGARALIVGTGGFRSLEPMERALAASGTEIVTVALRRVDPVAQGSVLEVARAARAVRAPEHGRLLHGPRRGAHGAARPRGVRDRLGQARGDRRRPDAAPRRGRAGRGGRDAGRRGLHRAAVHERRPDPGAAARGGRLRGGDAARLADRLRRRDPQPLQRLDHRRARRACR